MELALHKITGQPCKLRIEALVDNGAAAVAKPAEDTEEAQSRYRRQRAEALKEPLIKRAVEVLGAQVMEIEEGFGSAATPASDRVEPSDSEEA